jgi:putative transposase
VDTFGLLLAVVVHPANIPDREGAKLVFTKAKLLGSWPRLERVWADGGYAAKLIAWVSSFCRLVLGIVKRNDDVKGFKLLPKRWVVERPFSWLSNCRRLSKHYEYGSETGEAMVRVAMIHLMLRRLTKKTSGVGATQIPAPFLRRAPSDGDWTIMMNSPCLAAHGTGVGVSFQ